MNDGSDLMMLAVTALTPTRETFGNIPVSSQILFYFLAAAATAIFAGGVWRRFRLWRQGQPTDWTALLGGNLVGRLRLAALRPGLRRVVVEGFGQQRVRGRGLPSWAHAALVAGFLMLFLGTTLLEVDHLATMISGRLKFHEGAYYVAYEFTLDLFGLAFLLGVILFFWRRLRRPPSLGHRGTDWYVLLSFLGIGVTGYLVEGLRMTWQHPEGIGAHCSPVGYWLAALFQPLGDGPARSWHLGVWWLHSVLVFGFIASIPYTRLFHVVAGPLNLFLARPGLGFLQPITLEQVEKEERIGVSRITHLTQQQLVSLDACMECGRCEEACPAFATAKPLSPKRVVQTLKLVMEALPSRPRARAGAVAVPSGGGDAAVAGEGENSEAGNVHAKISAETLLSCTACSACTFVCPVRVDPLGLILDMRRHLVAEGGLAGTAATALRRLQSNSNPWGLSPADRGDWRQGLVAGPSPGSPPPPA